MSRAPNSVRVWQLRTLAVLGGVCIFAVLVPGSGAAVQAAEVPGSAKAAKPVAVPGRLEMRTERVVVFKDGYCLVLKSGAAVTDEQGEVHWTDVPDAAVLGSFWATPREGRLAGMVAGWAEATTREEKLLPCLETVEVLKANQGRECTVLLPGDKQLAGTIQAVLAQETAQPVSEALLPLLDSRAALSSSLRALAVSPTADAAERRLSTLSGSQFVLRTDEGDVLLPIAQVQRLTIRDMQTSLPRTLTSRQRTKRLTFRFAEPAQRQELVIAYFRPGLRWIPTYRVELPAPGAAAPAMAQMAMQAELINEAEDLFDAAIDVVVGVPNFRFRTVPSPLVLEQTMRNVLQQADPRLSSQAPAFSNALFTQRAGEFRGAPPAGPEQPGEVELPGELTAAAAQELFVYHLPKFSLRKGERAAIPVSQTRAPCRDVYTWDVHLQREDIATAPSGSGATSPLTLSENQIWRQIQLTNTSDVPWTTGAALIMQGGQPLAQELLTYTPPKGSCRVPVTVAVDLRGSYDVQETNRQLQALQWDSYHYAKISQRAQLEVLSFKPQPVDLEISLRFGGRAEQASDEGRISLAPYREDDWKQYRGSTAANNSSTVRWSQPLTPAQPFRPTVDYHFYTRH